MVNDTEFTYNNNRGRRGHDLNLDDRYARTQEFKRAVVNFYDTLSFLLSHAGSSALAIKYKGGVDELKKLNWK